MSLLNRISLLVILSAAFVSCGEEVVNNYYENEIGTGKLGVNVVDADYEIVTTFWSRRDTISPGFSYYNEAKLKLKLDYPENRNKINRLVMENNSIGYDFNIEELRAGYDSLSGSYNLTLFVGNERDFISSAVWEISLYDSSNNESNPYVLPAKLPWNYSDVCFAEWGGLDTLKFFIPNYVKPFGLNQTAEVLFLDSNYVELGNMFSPVTSSKWELTGTPETAIYYYIAFSDLFQDVKRKFVTRTFTIPVRK